MYESIIPVLDNDWVMFYHPCWPINKLQAVCDLEECLARCRDLAFRFGLDLERWPPGERYHAARLVRVNWIYNRLAQEPIRKPILAHKEGDKIVVDCGDTRLMALRLHDTNSTVGVIITDRVHQRGNWHGWIPITSDQELRKHTGFAVDAGILVRTRPIDHALEWLEIGDETTAHHLHDYDQRIRMMQRYLRTKDHRFLWDESWVKTPINWRDLDQDHPTKS